MYVKEIWRYPVKSMAGERLSTATVGTLGIDGDRTVLVEDEGRLVTARTDYKLLGLHGTFEAATRLPRINGYAWDSPEALALVRTAAGPDAQLVRNEGPERFDVLPLLIATDGAINAMGFDGRRLRPNLVIGGVDGFDERSWPGRRLHIGSSVVVWIEKLRGRCVMTTFDPDTLQQDRGVLRRIAKELGGTMALDCAVLTGGVIEEGAPVSW